jgi:hypothetical protein
VQDTVGMNGTIMKGGERKTARCWFPAKGFKGRYCVLVIQEMFRIFILIIYWTIEDN